MMEADDLATVLADKHFCPSCHRPMKAVAFMDVPGGVGSVPIEWECQECPVGKEYPANPS